MQTHEQPVSQGETPTLPPHHREAIRTPSASAQLPSRPDADAARNLRTAAEQSRPVVAIAPNGGWVVALGTRFVQRNVPSDLEAKLGEFTRAGRSIDAVAFTPDGRGWTVIAGDQSFTRNVGGSGGDAYHGIVNAFLNRGRGVRGVSFNPANWSRDRGYVIVWDDGTAGYRSIPPEMAAKIDKFNRERAGIRSIAFTPDGGWTIVAANRSFTRAVGGPQPSYFDTVRRLERDGNVQAVGFNPHRFDQSRGWFLLTKQHFEGRGLPEGMADPLRQLLRLAPGPLTEGGAPRPQVSVGVQRMRVLYERDVRHPYLVITAFRGRMGERDDRMVWLHPASGPVSTNRHTATFGERQTVDFGEVRPLEVVGTVTVVVDQQTRDPDLEQTVTHVVAARFANAMSRWMVDLDRLSPEAAREIARRSMDAVYAEMRETLRESIESSYREGERVRMVTLSFWIDVPGLSDSETVLLDSVGIHRVFGGLRRPNVPYKAENMSVSLESEFRAQ